MDRNATTAHLQLIDTAAANAAERARIANTRAQLAIARAKLAERKPSGLLANARPALVTFLACVDIALVAWAVSRVVA